MKATMQARLISCRVDNNQVIIEAVNLGDKRQRSSKQDKAIVPTPTIDLVVSNIAAKKITEIRNLISESNEITLKLELGNDLMTVTNILSTKVNGIDIDFSEIDQTEKENQAKLEAHQTQKKETASRIMAIIIALIIGLSLISFLSTLH